MKRIFREILALIVIVFCWVEITSQDIYDSYVYETGEFRYVNDYPCINFEQNKLTVPGSDSLLIALYDRIDQIGAMGQGQISILHIGGSHVQAGIFSHRLRENFRSLIGDFTSSKGVIFPFKTMGTNAPTNYRMSTSGVWTKARCVERAPSLPLGITGAAIRTIDSNASVSFDLRSTDSIKWEYDKLIVLGGDANGEVYPKLVCGEDTLVPYSFEEGAYRFQLPHEASEGKVIFSGANRSPLIFRGLIPQNSYSGLEYHEAGINGASVPAWLRCDKFEKELSYITPDIVIFGIGINDANVSPSKFSKEDFKANYRKLISRIKRVNPNVVCLFITNNDCKLNMNGARTDYNPNTLKVEQAFIELAEEYNGAVWNLFRIMGGPGSSKEWVKHNLMQSDRIHFKREGYEILGDLLYNAFVLDYRNLNIDE